MKREVVPKAGAQRLVLSSWECRPWESQGSSGSEMGAKPKLSMSRKISLQQPQIKTTKYDSELLRRRFEARCHQVKKNSNRELGCTAVRQ